MGVDRADRIRVLLVEGHRLVREGVRLLLERTPDIAVVGEAADGEAGVHLFARLATESGVDLVVCDLDLPDIDGLEVARRVKALAPGTPVVLLTMHDDEALLRGLVAVGADGYVLKQTTRRDLCDAIRAAMRGAGRGAEADRLSERERQVLGLLAAGLTSKEIARRLGLSERTVENHRARVLEKLGAANTAAAIDLAHQQGLLDPAGHEGAGP